MQNSIYNNLTTFVNDINICYASLHDITNDELRNRIVEIKNRINNCNVNIDDFIVEVFAIVKETARRFSEGDVIVTANSKDIFFSEKYDFVQIVEDKAVYKNKWVACDIPYQWGMIHYDEQLMGGILLHRGYAVEMATGEGKTLVATLPIMLNALTHHGVHVMTVNDYLSKRDCELTRPLYMFFGLTVDNIEYYYRGNDKDAYKADITFGSNSTFVFDYLRDHLATHPSMCRRNEHYYAIIDEIDSVLIDDAQTPHIIGGGNWYNEENIYKENLPIIKEFIDANNGLQPFNVKCRFETKKDCKLFTVSHLNKSIRITSKGKEWLADRKNNPELFTINKTYELKDFEKLDLDSRNRIWANLTTQNVLYQLLRAFTVFERDIDYIVTRDGKIKIIDKNTGRIRETSRWEHGLHTAIEVKENVEVQNDFDGMAVISLKNFFKLYNKVAGMSGTIMSAEKEFRSVYGLKCAALPTHKPVIRVDEPLRIYHTCKEKEQAIVNLVIENYNSGRPTLVGCVDLKRSDSICKLLDDEGIPFNRLDAKTLKEEAATVAKAGIGNTITIATSVAGRGTDIKPTVEVLENGGLLVIGTDLYDSIRIDNQLKGRTGRQGNPGTTVFFGSLEDKILNYLDPNGKELLNSIVTVASNKDLNTPVIRDIFKKAQFGREKILRQKRISENRKDDIVAPRRQKFYTLRNEMLFNSECANKMIVEIAKESHTSLESIDKHIKELYDKTKELFRRSLMNNPFTKEAFVPFSDNMHTFAIRFNIDSVMDDQQYFELELKRQISLQVYDKCWKKFVVYMLGNLDNHEVNLLDGKLDKMLQDVNTIILSRLTQSSIPFDCRNNNRIQDDNENEKKHISIAKIKAQILPEELCPCGSNKKYCECHGCSIHSNTRRRQRR